MAVETKKDEEQAETEAERFSRRRRERALPEGVWRVETPNKDYAGFTCNVEFFRGRAEIDDEYAEELGFKDALTLLYILQDDFGYAVHPELPARVTRPRGRGLADRFAEVMETEGGAQTSPIVGRYCTHCGAEAATDDWQFCGACGKPRGRHATASGTADTRAGDPGRVAPFYKRDDLPAGSDPAVAIPKVSQLHETREPASTGEGATNGDQEGQGQQEPR